MYFRKPHVTRPQTPVQLVLWVCPNQTFHNAAISVRPSCSGLYRAPFKFRMQLKVLKWQTRFFAFSPDAPFQHFLAQPQSIFQPCRLSCSALNEVSPFSYLSLCTDIVPSVLEPGDNVPGQRRKMKDIATAIVSPGGNVHFLSSHSP